MNLSAICHISGSNYAYAYNKNELHIRLRTAKDDMDSVDIFYGNKYDWINKVSFPMKKILSDELFDYYEYRIVGDDSRLGYYFGLTKDYKTLYYTEAGYVDEFNDDKSYCYFFQYPYINEIDVHRTPDWVRDTNFYQIFVERFCNGNPSNSPKNVSPWGTEPTPVTFMGGDLIGIIKKLDYLEELGIKGIYLTPIFESVSNHKYDTTDYMKIDKYFGNEEALRLLIEECHKRNIKIVLDAVFNHCGKGFAPFQDVIKNGKKSEYFDWFYIAGEEVEFEPINFQAFGFVPYMPKMNTSNQRVKKYLYDVISYWTKEFDIDGWRLDVSDELDHEFWRGFRKLVKGINPQAVIIGENWHNSYPWLMGDQFDSVMNYSLTKLCLDYFATNEINARTFMYEISSLLIRYSKQVNESMLNLLDSHDTERFLTTAKGEVKYLKNAAAFLYAYVGMPCTYYGTEIGMDGVYDPGCRKAFDWNEDNWNKELYSFYRRLIKLRNEEAALKYGEVEFIYNDDVFAMKRSYEDDCIYVVINNTDEAKTVDTGIKDEELYDILNEEDIKNNLGMIKVLPKTAHYIKKKEGMRSEEVKNEKIS